MRAQVKRKAKSKPQKAIVRVAAPPEKPWELKQDEVTLVKNQICKGASDEELQLCLTVARRYKLDPFRGQIWFVKRNDKSAQGGYRWVPVVGIDGLQHIAARDHKDYGSVDEPEYGPMHKVEWSHYEKKGFIMAPEWARVRAWKKGADKPTTATVYWEEIYPSIGASPLVRQMPRLMLGKCARAQAIRQSYPATDGLYIREEFQGPPDFTDSGRRIIYPDAEQGAPAALDENARHGHDPASPKAKIAENTLAAVEAEDRRLAEERKQKTLDSQTAKPVAAERPTAPKAESKNIPGSTPGRGTEHVAPRSGAEGLNPSSVKPSPKYSIEIDLTNPESPIVRGDVDMLIPMEKHITKIWGADGFWHVRPQDVATIYAASKTTGAFRVTEFPSQGKGAAVQGKAGPGTPAQTKTAAPQQIQRKESTKSTVGAGGPSGAQPDILVKGTIERVFVTIRGNKSMAIITIKTEDGKKREAGCWDKDIYERLEKGKGQLAEVWFRPKGQYTDLIGLQRIGSQEFIDGKIPVVQRNREPGGQTLF